MGRRHIKWVGACVECGDSDARKYKRRLCENCYARFYRLGLLDDVRHPVAYKGTLANDIGSRRKDASRGYIMVKTEDGWKLEHRAVMEDLLGRSLNPDEHVHHKNGIKTDNSPDNLELWHTLRQPHGQRVDDLIEYVAIHHAEAVIDAIRRVGESACQ